ncbi:hypothetical protein BFW89_10075 [Pseudomonas synxantha]|nr:hypothetical protein BFW89_10075 [Pseudomonas synxantha]
MLGLFDLRRPLGRMQARVQAGALFTFQSCKDLFSQCLVSFARGKFPTFIGAREGKYRVDRGGFDRFLQQAEKIADGELVTAIEQHRRRRMSLIKNAGYVFLAF